MDCPLLSGYTVNDTIGLNDRPPTLFVAVQTSEPHSVATRWSVTQCALANTSYSVFFNFSNGERSLEVTKAESAVLQPLRTYLADGRPCDQLDTSTSLWNTTFNYLTLFELTAQQVLGVLSVHDVFVPSIFNSPIARADELVQLYRVDSSPNPFGGTWGSELSTSWSTSSDRSGIGPLAEVLQDRFQNTTLAMLTSGEVTKMQAADVTFWEPQARYNYAWQRLWLSYGIGIGVTALVVAIGCYKVLETGTSYQTRFSTYLRTVHWTDTENIIEGGVYDGAEPVPKSVAEATVKLGGLGQDSRIPFREGTSANEPALTTSKGRHRAWCGQSRSHFHAMLR